MTETRFIAGNHLSLFMRIFKSTDARARLGFFEHIHIIHRMKCPMIRLTIIQF